MTRTIPVVDPQMMYDVLKQTTGNYYARMEQATSILLGQGVSAEGTLAVTERIKALGELLQTHPELTKSHSDRAVSAACALCELVEPPMSLVEADHAAFDRERFRQMMSSAEL